MSEMNYNADLKYCVEYLVKERYGEDGANKVLADLGNDTNADADTLV